MTKKHFLISSVQSEFAEERKLSILWSPKKDDVDSLTGQVTDHVK